MSLIIDLNESGKSDVNNATNDKEPHEPIVSAPLTGVIFNGCA
jgi:hypothetical protein